MGERRSVAAIAITSFQFHECQQVAHLWLSEPSRLLMWKLWKTRKLKPEQRRLRSTLLRLDRLDCRHGNGDEKEHRAPCKALRLMNSRLCD